MAILYLGSNSVDQQSNLCSAAHLLFAHGPVQRCDWLQSQWGSAHAQTDCCLLEWKIIHRFYSPSALLSMNL